MTAAPYLPAPTATSKKVLVADDDPVILQTLALKLKSNGYRVVTVSDGSQAISATRQEKPDLLLLDVNFPPDVGGVAWTGFSITQWLRQTDYARNLPVVVISAADRLEYKRRALDAGATGFLRKPIDSQELLASIDMALCGSATEKSATQAEPVKCEPMIGPGKPESHSKPQHAGLDHLNLDSL